MRQSILSYHKLKNANEEIVTDLGLIESKLLSAQIDFDRDLGTSTMAGILLESIMRF